MESKSFLIAIAAFALTATGVQAYGGSKILTRAGLTEEQVEAFAEARELRESGDFTGARNKLVSAGITEDTMQSMRQAARESRSAIHEALETGDYQAFKEAIADSPLADIITSEADFEQFKEAHELRLAGDWEEADEIMDDLGLEAGPHGHGGGQSLGEFTDEQREALRVARQSNDRATMQAIFDEAGVTPHMHHRGR